MINAINQALNACRPFVQMAALLFGVLAAWMAVSDLFPVLKQIYAGRGNAQTHAILAAALAIVGGNR